MLDFRMRYAQAAWEKERNGWRSVIQLNVVRSITTILGVVEAAMSGDVLAASDEDEGVQSEKGEGEGEDDEEVRKFTDRHQLLMIRLAPLRGVETELKRRLGAGADPVQPALSMSATPFDEPADNEPPRRALTEFAVRSWKAVLDPDTKAPTSDDGDTGLDSATLTIAGCKDDMKSLWEDKTVRLALKRRKLRLPDSAGLYASLPCSFGLMC